MITLAAMARLPLTSHLKACPLGLSRCDSDEGCSWEFTLLQDLRTTRDSRDGPDCLGLAASMCSYAQCVVEAILSRQLNDLEPQLIPPVRSIDPSAPSSPRYGGCRPAIHAFD
jgi:hypothetical protein